MSEQMRYRDWGTGEFVTAEYAAEHPDTTGPDTFAAPSQLHKTLARITELTDSQVTFTGHGPAGITETGVDPEDVADRILRRVEALMGEAT